MALGVWHSTCENDPKGPVARFTRISAVCNLHLSHSGPAWWQVQAQRMPANTVHSWPQPLSIQGHGIGVRHTFETAPVFSLICHQCTDYSLTVSCPRVQRRFRVQVVYYM